MECAGKVMAAWVEWDIPFCSLLRCVQVLSALDEVALKHNLLLLLGSCWRDTIEREECVAVWRNRRRGFCRVFACFV